MAVERAIDFVVSAFFMVVMVAQRDDAGEGEADRQKCPGKNYLVCLPYFESVKSRRLREPVSQSCRTMNRVWGSICKEAASDGKVRLRNWWSRLVSGQGHHGGLARYLAQGPWLQGHHAEDGPLSQRRPRHHEPLPAWRGLRHRRWSRERPRPGALRALHRREPHA